MFLIVCGAVIGGEQSKSIFFRYSNFAAAIFFFLVLATTVWNWLRLRRVDQVLFQSQIVNHQS